MTTPHLFIFGLGFSGLHTARAALAKGWRVSGTVRSAEKARALRDEGIDAHVFDGKADTSLREAVVGATHILSTAAPPRADGAEARDPVLPNLGDAILAAPRLQTLAYLSTIGVYGDHDGAWIDETAPTAGIPRAVSRVRAEGEWLALGEAKGVAAQVFRLGGIYGPGRSQLDALREGRARRIVKPGQVFNRTHVEEVAQAVLAGANSAVTGVFNIVDDEPAPPGEVVAFGAELLGLAPPPEVPFDEAPLSPMGREFYGANRRVSNARAKDLLGWRPAYPTYREGLRAVLEAEG